MNKITVLLVAGILAVGSVPALADGNFFQPTDSLAARDGWGLLHQSPDVSPTDYEPHFRWRPFYYLQSGHSLSQQPAYVGALQTALRRLGYYCGPVDGIFSDDVREGIARLQKNYSMRVTGTLTFSVRRALYLP